MATVTYSQIYYDMRGASFSSNQLHVKEGKLYYCGFPVHNITATHETTNAIWTSKFLYVVICCDLRLGEIALSDEALNQIKPLLTKEI